MKKSIRSNYLFNMTYQILLIMTPFITTPYVSRVLGADGVGTYSFTSSIASYFTLFAALGTGIYGQREISFCQQNKNKRSKVFWTTELLSLFTAGLFLLLYILFLVFQKNNRLIYLILALNIVSVAADITWFFQGMENFKKIVVRNMFFKIISITYIFLFVKGKSDIGFYALGMSLFPLLGNLSLWLYLPRYIIRIPFSKIHPLRIYRVVISLFIPTIAIQIYTTLDKTVLGLFTATSVENGYYEQSQKMVKILLAIVTSIGTVMIPRIGSLYKAGDPKNLKKYMYKTFHFIWFISIPLAFGIFGISDNFVPWFFGMEFQKVAILLKISCFLIIAIGINNVTGWQYLVPTERQNKFTVTVVAAAVFDFLLNLLLVPHFYSVGSSISSVLAEILIAVSQLFIIRKELSVKHILKLSIKYLFTGLSMLALLRFENRILTPSISHTFIMVLSGSAFYFAMLLIMRDKFCIYNGKMLIKSFLMKISPEK